MIRHKSILYLSAIFLFSSEGVMAGEIPKSEIAQELKAIYRNKPLTPEQEQRASSEGDKFWRDKYYAEGKAFKEGVSAAKSEIGDESLKLAETFQRCVQSSTGLFNYSYGDASGPAQLLGRDVSPADAKAVVDIATVQCAAQTFGLSKGP